jgi:sensor histidine kinase YesM
MVVGAIMFIAVVVTANLGPQDGWRRWIALSAAIIGSAACAVAVRWGFIPWVYSDHPEVSSDYLRVLRFDGTSYVVLAGLLTLVAELYRRERAHLDDLHRTNFDRSNLERQMAQARLQVLQAQIEPHFLFNTLANVRRLYETDRDAGHAMLDNLMRYFKVALPQMRGNTSTVEREAALAEAYLNVQQIRFGRRLWFDIDIPHAVKALEVPPMMLMTLVENAVKHGIAPLPQGGTIGVVAEVADGRLVLSVRDTGRGLSETAGAGMGLANIRARLAAAYGNSAGLSITGNQPRGIVATLSLPIVEPAFA